MHRCPDCSEKCECQPGETPRPNHDAYCIHPGCLEDPFGREPKLAGPERCPFCGTYIRNHATAYWVVEKPTDIRYTAYCNETHFQKMHKTGLFEEPAKQKLPPLSME